jgi:hypothetical protein
MTRNATPRSATPGLAAALLTTLLAAAAPLTAQAQASDAWKFEVSLYGWFPAISGTTSFPPNGNGPSVDVSMGDVIDALKFAFMGTFEARSGQWGVWTDLVYSDFGASHGTTLTVRPPNQPAVPVKADAQLDIKSWIWTLAGLYGLKSDADGTMDLLFGARLLDMTNQLEWSLAGPGPITPSGTKEVSSSYWDAVVGLKGRALLGADRKWFIPYYADIGTGQSKLTWQVNAGVGYQFDWGAVQATWRYLSYDFDNSSKVQSLNFNGPTIGVAFRF